MESDRLPIQEEMRHEAARVLADRKNLAGIGRELIADIVSLDDESVARELHKLTAGGAPPIEDLLEMGYDWSEVGAWLFTWVPVTHYAAVRDVLEKAAELAPAIVPHEDIPVVSHEDIPVEQVQEEASDVATGPKACTRGLPPLGL